jgi:hypothetical protein
MEDLPRPCSQVAGADGYAKKHDPFLYWDEGSSSDGCCTDAHGGRIATIVAGHDVRRHARSSRPVDHYGALRTIENHSGSRRWAVRRGSAAGRSPLSSRTLPMSAEPHASAT